MSGVRVRLKSPDSNKTACAKPGAIHPPLAAGSFIGMGSLDAARESLKSRQLYLSIPYSRR